MRSNIVKSNTRVLAFTRSSAERIGIAMLAAILVVWAGAANARTAPESFADLAERLLPWRYRLARYRSIRVRAR